MSETNFKPLFDYIDQSVKELLELIASKEDFEKLQNSLGALAKRFDRYKP